jgi:hypothetical protein
VGYPLVGTSRIARTHTFPVQSDSGEIRNIVCSEEHVSAGRYYSPTGSKSYEFENGEPVATIGDAFLDRAGNIYRRMTQ